MCKLDINFKTDMADERVDVYKRFHNLSSIDGVKVSTEKENDISTTVVEILNENGSQALQKDIGKYITIELKDVKYLDEHQRKNIIDILVEQIKALIGTDNSKSILVVGLGNSQATPDSLGPKVVENLDITRHLLNFAKDFMDPDTRSVSGISPGVLGTTGIETSEIVNSVVSSVKPDIIIAIDSLASSSFKRVGNTIQLSNTGITPGSGVRNKREGLNEKTLNVPVIAIGVPTVVDIATITNETLDKVIENNEFIKNIEFTNSNLSDRENRQIFISNTLDTENYIVTPKEVDELIEIMSDIISSGINMAM